MIVLALIAPCGANATEVGSIRFEGRRAASAAALRAQIFTESRPWWKPWQPRPELPDEAAEADARRLVLFYRSLGYFDARVTTEVRPVHEGERADVIFHIEEGRPVLLTQRDLVVPDAIIGTLPADRFEKDLALVTGEVFSLERYEASKKEVLARLAEEARPLAQVEGGADVWVPEHEAALTWRVEPGPRVRFGSVSLLGLDRIDEELARRELTLHEGDPYSLSALRETRANLQSLRVFRSVIASPRPEDAETTPDGEVVWPIDVTVSELPPHSLRLGLGYATDEGPRVQAGYVHRNFLGAARLLDTTLRYSSLERTFRATLAQPNWLVRRQSLQFETTLGQLTTPAYDAEQLRIGALVSRSFEGPWSARAGYEASISRISKARSSAERLFDDPDRDVLLSGLRLGATRSTVTDALDPRDGSRLDLSAAPFLSVLGSDEDFIAASIEGRTYRPIGPVVVAARLKLATIEPFGSTGAGDVPLTERLYLGGSTTVRGFQYWRLGPRDADGDPVGGTSSILASLELRFPIRGPLEGVVFTDTGQVSLDPHDFVPTDLSWSVGIGARLRTPLGPVRLDLAWPLNPPDGARTTFFHFSIGQAF